MKTSKKQQLSRIRRRRERNSNSTQARLCIFERLEDRALLSVDFIEFSAGALTVPANRPDLPIGLVNGNTQPAIAISSVDPGRVAVANEAQSIVSTTAGNSFTAPVDFPSSLAVGHSDVATDNSGRLFWTTSLANSTSASALDVGVRELDPITGQTLGTTAFLLRGADEQYDRPSLVADVDLRGTSSYAGNLYTTFTSDRGTEQVLLARSTDGDNWSVPIEVSAISESNPGGLTPVAPSRPAVAPNGDVYVAYQFQPGVTPQGGPDMQSDADGISGRVIVRRSTDGGRSFVSKSAAFGPGEADISVNVKSLPASIPGIRFSTDGARRPWILADPVREGHIYVIANDDPDNAHGHGDDGDIVLARSTDFGETWQTSTIGSNGDLQIMPTATIDAFGNIIVAWYDTRRGLTQQSGDARLDVFATYSTDGGTTWSEAFRITDDGNPIDPVTPNTRVIHPGADLDGDAGTLIDGDETFSLGRHFSAASFGGSAFVAWNGNQRTDSLPLGHQVFLQVFSIHGALRVMGTDRADSILVRAMPDNPEFVEVFVNGQREYAGLIDALTGGILIDGSPGNDTLTVDFSNGDPVPSGGMFFDGNIPEGGTQLGDQLNLLTNDATLDYQSEEFDQDAGLFLIGGTAQVSFDSVETLWVDAIRYLRPDNSEENDSLAAATVLGSEPAVTLRDRTIHDVGDSQSNPDYYQLTASATGKLIINTFFPHALGNLELEVFDSRGHRVRSANSDTNNEHIVIPVVSQESYFVHVFGVEGAVNTYDLEIEHFAVPLVETVTLSPESDTGMMADDSVTSDTTPRILIQADLPNLRQSGVPILTAEQAEAGRTPGVAVFVTLVSDITGETLTGFADPIGVSDLLFEYTPSELPNGTFFVSAATQVFDVRADDNGPDPVTQRSRLVGPLRITIDAQGPQASTPFELLASSDTGMTASDRVTHINQPAFAGTSEPNTKVRLLANDSLVGDTVAASDGRWEVTSEPLRDGVYSFRADFEDLAGNITSADASLFVEIDTIAPNTPFLDLLEADDSGRHNDDNITNAESLRLVATTTDANVAQHQALFPDGQNLKYRVYARLESGSETLLYDSARDGSLTDLLDGLTALEQIELPGLALPEGLHNLKLEVEDRAGNISDDFLLDVIVDRTAFAGTGELRADNDTGVWGLDFTFGDGITSQVATTLMGTAEANSLVSVSVDGVTVGTTVAMPRDGDDAFQPIAAGNWQLTSPIPVSGSQAVSLSFEDVAGNRVVGNLDAGETNIVLDAIGPRIENVTRAEPGFPSLFDPKPAGGPDPLVDRVLVHFSDAPSRIPSVPYAAVITELATEEGNYSLIGDHHGPISIVAVNVVDSENGPGTARTTVELVFDEPLPDDRYTFEVFDGIADAAGNPLDGESGAYAPFEGSAGRSSTGPNFPSGDGNHGGAFKARFTIDSRPEIGVWAAGSVWADTNGNFFLDPENDDRVNRDLTYTFGFTSDDVFVGNFAATGDTDGYDKLAAYGYFEGSYRWLIDTNNDGVWDVDQNDALRINGLPVAGRFDNSDANGDEVGLYTGSMWYFDTDHDFQVDLRLGSNLIGYPVVGDFDGDGFDDLATWADDEFQIDLARGSRSGWDGSRDVSFRFGFIGVRERPVSADMDQDGFADLGLWVPDRSGSTPREHGEWFWLISAGTSLLNRVAASSDAVRNLPHVTFTPEPLGRDLYARFGDEFALPVVGNFDPPVLPKVDSVVDEESITNPHDVNRDGFVSPRDVLIIINWLNSQSSADRQMHSATNHLDVSGDGVVSARDALLVIDALRQPAAEETILPSASTIADNSHLVSDAVITPTAADLAAALISQNEDDEWSWSIEPNKKSVTNRRLGY